LLVDLIGIKRAQPALKTPYSKERCEVFVRNPWGLLVKLNVWISLSEYLWQALKNSG
jgi:hypothetical protein|tara:strand:+ start:2259 stop:2429 length:171 start_codon:yes stop_codon:yes gene_type:complete